ncbi:MAG: Fur family transcriptional regulator [Desulfobulbales bacterium]
MPFSCKSINFMGEVRMIEPAVQTFEDYLKKNSLKMTNQRQLVAQAFFSQKEHLSAEDLYRKVQKKFPVIGFTTVYRTLNLLVEAGLASTHHFKGSFTQFEPRGRKEHHDHLICTVCGKIIEFTNDRIEKLQREVARKHNFEVSDHTLEIFGRCIECRKQ